jgi:hypothetical protein
MKPKPQQLIYTILSDDEPIAALEATGKEARELCKAGWFLDELSLLKSNGIPLYGPGIRLRARPATEDEWLRFDAGAKEAGESEDMLFVYLVELDR